MAEAVKQDFTSPAPKADLKAANEDFLKKHAQSPDHLMRGYSVRYHLDPATKSQSESDIQKILDLPSVSLAQATAGLTLLNQWKSEAAAVDAYREAAAKKWPQATLFQSQK